MSNTGSVRHLLFHFGPAVIALIAALVYAGTVVFQYWHPTTVARAGTTQEQFQQSLLNFKLALPRLPQAECDAIPHYTPAISAPLYGSIIGVTNEAVKLKNEKGVQTIMLTSSTRIIGLGKLKSPQNYAKEASDFSRKSRACNDGTRVYMSPNLQQEIVIKPGDLKPPKGVEIFMDETVDGGKTHAAYIQIMEPVKSR